jgi:hypothetical protein
MGSEGKGRGECNVYKMLRLVMANIATARGSEEGGTRCRSGAEVTDLMPSRATENRQLRW